MVREHFGSLKGFYIEKRSDDVTKTNFVMLLWDWSAYSAKKMKHVCSIAENQPVRANW